MFKFEQFQIHQFYSALIFLKKSGKSFYIQLFETMKQCQYIPSEVQFQLKSSLLQTPLTKKSSQYGDQSAFKTSEKQDNEKCKWDNSDENTNGFSITFKDIQNLKEQKFPSIKQLNFEKNYQRIQSFKALLPQFLTTRLPEQFESLCEKQKIIDKYLSKLNLDKKDYITNIIQSIKDQYELEIQEKNISQICFICPNFYQYYIYKDQTIIGYHFTQSIQKRKQIFRKSLVEYVKKCEQSKQIMNDTYQLPEAAIQWLELKKFILPKYPSKTKLIKKVKSHGKQKNKHEEKIANYIKEKQIELRKYQQTDIQLNDLSSAQVTTILNEIKTIYQEKKVHNIFRVTLIEILQSPKHGAYSLKNIIKALNILKEYNIFESITTKKGNIIKINSQLLNANISMNNQLFF